MSLKEEQSMFFNLSTPQTTIPKNNYNGLEWAGAFGDMGTLLPFIIGFVAVTKLNPTGILFTFGLSMLLTGLYYKTPMPVQPMKVIGGIAITQAGTITSGMIFGAGFFTGILWTVLALTNSLKYVAKLVTKPIICGIALGLGMSFIRSSITMMTKNWTIAIIALFITFILLKSRRFPAMFALLLLGLLFTFIKEPSLFLTLLNIKPQLYLPSISLIPFTWKEFLEGALIMGIPQAPLTLGNAVVAVTAENNRLFPDRPTIEKKVALSQGLMNLIAPFFGGVSMCHGVGGMSGHVRFGAQTGGALVIIGSILLTMALFFSSSINIILQIFPEAIVGVILFFAGLEVAASAVRVGNEKNDFYVMLVTAGFGMWNMGAGFLAGVMLQFLLRRNWIKI
jgi:MFS superfamily sulfate permease-like transporter